MANSLAKALDNLRYAVRMRLHDAAACEPGWRLHELGLSAPCQRYNVASRGYKLCVRQVDVFRSQQASYHSHPRMQVDSQHTGTSADLSTMACIGPPAETVTHKSYGS